ncbi:MAG: nuclear transport factor 2 family protein [Pseudomonadota bacterium]|nr:nuclear transport factor 2 family protein [Pseudomonadota bacterium]
MGSAMQELLETEYAFALLARASVRLAFLEYLAEDSLVLRPGPVAGRAFYAAAPESQDQLEWYPTVADVTGSNDLGFTSGPWVYTLAASGGQFHGHFLSLWKREARGLWRLEFDGGISHAAPATVEGKLVFDSTLPAEREAPPAKLVAADELGHTIGDFEIAVQKNGLPAGLRTYARTGDFRLYIDGELPLPVDAAIRQLDMRHVAGSWKQVAKGRSADSILAYTVGELVDANSRGSYAYAQIWQYDPRVANWGLRILLLRPLAAPARK